MVVIHHKLSIQEKWLNHSEKKKIYTSCFFSNYMFDYKLLHDSIFGWYSNLGHTLCEWKIMVLHYVGLLFVRVCEREREREQYLFSKYMSRYVLDGMDSSCIMEESCNLQV